MSRTGSKTRRKWVAPEIVQTSSMDCGPAALACVLGGFQIPVTFGRLREACQTDVDGTSIDALEVVANQLGLNAEQVMLPIEHLFLATAQVLPAIVVVRHADLATHFVVVWRRLGQYLQVMDPSIGRRWVSCQRFADEVFCHEQRVLAVEWRKWAATGEFLIPLKEQLSEVGVSGVVSSELIARASRNDLWFGLAALDACARFVRAVIDAGGMGDGSQSAKLLVTVFDQTIQNADDIFKIVPKSYWSAAAGNANDSGALELLLQGAVLLKISDKRSQVRPDTHTYTQVLAQRSPELAAAVAQKPPGPFHIIWGFLKLDGLLGPVALGGAVAVAAAVVLIELLLFRGLFEVTTVLNLPSQRIAAVTGLLAMVGVIMLIEVPISSETMRLGRRLEVRLRMALLEKLPKLSDRYLQSRPVSDMADRSHSIHFTRMVPGYGLHLVGLVCDLCFTLVGIFLIDPQMMGLAIVIVVVAAILPLFVQPFLNERDLRARNHGGALQVFYLDALLGLVPIRTHRAERAVRRQHEGLLVEWVKSMRGFNRVALSAGSAQALVCVSLAAFALYAHFMRTGLASGADLLLIFWTLKLPALGGTFASMATQFPMQRNILLRLLEPLSAPAEVITAPVEVTSIDKPGESPLHSLTSDNSLSASLGTSLDIDKGTVIAAGHILLHGVTLKISPGEHVAIVGSSGAGKSTLIGLILGWHRLATGRFLLNDATATPLSHEGLRRETAWVDPAIQIWNRSFIDNLMYASDEEHFERINEVLESANLRRVLQILPEGLQTLLGEGGALISGGEGQRLRLARAFMQSNVKLALLDEPFRGLDRTQRGKLLAEVRQWWQGATLLCVTHDIAETRSFDRVLVVENGRIVEDGAPAALGRTNSRYRELLDAETDVHRRIWSGKQWRHLRAENGKVTSSATEEVQAPRGSSSLQEPEFTAVTP
jgi:ABC-type bacteriocin/lantibiotic exporter with double-glycine peptidase domain